MSSIKVIIPARYGSSRLEGKPLLEINAKPIFWHVFRRCIESGFSRSDIFLATDDKRIFEKAKSLSINAIMTSIQHKSGTDRINEVVELMSWDETTLVLNVQGDEPLIPAGLIKELIKFSNETTIFSIYTAATKISTIEELNDPNTVKVVVDEYDQALYFSRASIPFNRDAPYIIEHAHRHIGIYLYRVEALRKFCSFPESGLEKTEKLEQLRALSQGMKIGVKITSSNPTHGIDTWDDYERTKKIMEG
ncbi:3-deoxy-manno-octulosonate cytidylyltransferase [Paraglaciecola chathamensis]|uniref:3-deoxy-manno-octulosonate cytidylyltransferase n=1 Tax=Paraglaciecola chathamensis TaxID=368405 RepID=UPI0027011CCE|nr:3-deoxy-manno-octulosonate cytidylyltransferase [Paraglaciecola chathamensis]MDO6559655.1 3-deoxy-manno-octulosonate cytidylyltransferase [Paraglaciecola chathamensis]